MSLPLPLAAALVHHFGASPHDIAIISHGMTGHVARCTLDGTRYLIKWAAPLPAVRPGRPDPFSAEAYGLRLLAAPEGVRVPEVHLEGAAGASGPGFIVTEWIDVAPHPDKSAAGAILGRKLAEQHRRSAPAYGLDHDNYCGATPQLNGWHDSWLDFYRERRLRPQMELAAAGGHLPAARRERLERLINRLDQWLEPRPEPPSLLHGDLWSGNWLIGTDGMSVLIDPAVYYGHREAELAMCRLFGGFPQSFYDAYDDAWPPLPGRDDRLPLYQLYHLLNHLNIFGESYGGQVDQVLQRYVG